MGAACSTARCTAHCCWPRCTATLLRPVPPRTAGGPSRTPRSAPTSALSSTPPSCPSCTSWRWEVAVGGCCLTAWLACRFYWLVFWVDSDGARLAGGRLARPHNEHRCHAWGSNCPSHIKQGVWYRRRGPGSSQPRPPWLPLLVLACRPPTPSCLKPLPSLPVLSRPLASVLGPGPGPCIVVVRRWAASTTTSSPWPT